MIRRVVVGVVATMACGSAPHQGFEQYQTTSRTITAAQQSIERAMADAETAMPSRPAVVVVDATRLVSKCSDAPLSEDCTVGSRVRNDCVALPDHRTIVCDGAFLSTLWLFAVFQAEKDPGTWDAFFACTFAATAKHPGELNGIADQIHVGDPALAKRYFDAFVRLVVLHEMGHTRSISERGTDAAELEADAFAIRSLSQDPRTMAMALYAFPLFDRYIRSVSALAIGQPGGCRDSCPDPPARKMEEYEAIYEGLSCPDQHAPFSSRFLRMIADPAAKPIYSNPPPWLEQFTTFAKEQQETCTARVRSKVRQPLDADDTAVLVREPKSEIRILDAGREPRAAIHYAFPDDDDAQVFIERQVSGRRSTMVDGREVTGDNLSTASDFEVHFGKTPNANMYPLCRDAPYTVNLALVTSDDGRLGREFYYTWCVDLSGRVLGVGLSNRGHNRPVANRAEAMAQLDDVNVRPRIVPFPDEPIGVGAKWSALSAEGSITFELKSRTGDRLDVEARTTPTSAAAATEPQPRLDIVAAYKLSLRDPVPELHEHDDLLQPVRGSEHEEHKASADITQHRLRQGDKPKAPNDPITWWDTAKNGPVVSCERYR